MLITPSGERVNIFFGATVQSVISKEFFFYEKTEKHKITIGSPRFVQSLLNIRGFTLEPITIVF